MAYASYATGVLLAAGYGSRFDPDGRCNKLLARLPDGTPVAHEAARRLRRVVEQVIAVVRPGSEQLAQVLSSAGCQVVYSADAARGMGASLAAGVRACSDAASWIVALADMPYVAIPTIEAIASALDDGAMRVAPFHRSQRGHPVGFGARYYDALRTLDGDTGARALLAARALTRVIVDDPGILRDIDRPGDLLRASIP